MNAPVLDTAARANPSVAVQPAFPASGAWLRIGLPLALGLLALGALFSDEITAAVRTWNASTAYNHCFLIVPIALYLLWDRRFDVAGIAQRPMPAVALLGLPLAAIWLVAERLGIMEGRQLAVISFAQLLFLGVLGRRLWWALAGPLLYLYFLVPFGEFLTPRLQDITTWFVRHGLDVLGVPAFIDGYVIEIPQGTFFVAQACAGLRFLIASIAFGCLYALIMYRSPVRRGLFILMSVFVPIIANGFRALGIVYLGHLLNSAEAAAADHIIYGWLFFSAVILILIALGLPFRQDSLSTQGRIVADHRSMSPPTVGPGLVAMLGIVVVSAISPASAGVLSMAAAGPVRMPAAIDFGAGCSVQAVDKEGMSPEHARSQRVTCGNVAMDLSWKAFSPRITAAPLLAEQRRLAARAMTEGLQEHWLDPQNGTMSTWRIMTANESAFAMAVSLWVEGKPVRPGLAMRVQMAIDSLFGSRFSPMVVAVAPAMDWDSATPAERGTAEASVEAFLLSHRDLDRIISVLSRRSDPGGQ